MTIAEQRRVPAASVLEAKHLRAQAQTLLERAAGLDGKHPFSVSHTHEYGQSTRVLWVQKFAASEVTKKEAISVLEGEFEPEKDEYLSVDSLTWAEITGADVGESVSEAVQRFHLPFGTTITASPGCKGQGVSGAIQSRIRAELLGEEHFDGSSKVDSKAIGYGISDGIESLLLALAVEGLDLADPRVGRALETAVQSCGNSL